MLKTIL